MNVTRLAKFIAEHSLQRGQFTLASGKTSDYLIDLKMSALHPHGAVLIADAILDHVYHYCDILDAFGGMAVGAVPIVAVVCARNFLCKPIPAFYVRKASKDHGTEKLIDGHLSPGMRTILIEDVTTTGGSVLRAVDAVRAFGAHVIEVVSVVDRLEGAADNFRAHNVEFTALLTRRDLGV